MGLEQAFVAHRDARRLDAAWCTANALVALGGANPDVLTFHSGNLRGLTKAAQPLPWRELAHPDELSALLAMHPMQGERPTGFAGVRRKDRRDMTNDPLIVSKLFAYVASVLDVRPPELYILEDDGPALEVFRLRDGKELVPAMVCRPRQLSGQNEKQMAFLATVTMTALRSADGVIATARRAGAVIAGDLATAFGLTPKEAHADLLAFWTSEAHFAIRQQMGLAIRDPLGAAAPKPRPPTNPPFVASAPADTLAEQFAAHKNAKRWDEAWCLAHALVATNAATPEIADYHTTFKRGRDPLGPFPIRELQHPDEDVTFSLELAKTWRERALPFAKTLAQANVTAEQRCTLESANKDSAKVAHLVRLFASMLDLKAPVCFHGSSTAPMIERVVLVEEGEPYPAFIFRDVHRFDEKTFTLETVKLVADLVLTRLPYRLRHFDTSLPARWCAAVDATARRATLLIHGLELALLAFPAEAHADLVAFWTSETHFRIRRETLSA